MIPAFINFVVLLAISAIHFYWIAGGRWGLANALPEQNGTKTMKPGPISTLSVAIIFGAMGFFYLYKIGQFPLADSVVPGWLNRYGLWLLAGIFLLRAIGDFRYVGFFKRIRNSRFAVLDTRFYSPLCLFLSLNTVLLIFSLSRS